MICNAPANTALATMFFGTPHLALFSADPTQSGSFTNEMAGGSYVRKPVTFAPPSGRSILTSIGVWWADFPATPIRYVGVTTALTGGSLIAYQLVSSTGIIVPDGQRFYISAGDLAFTIN